MTNDKHIIYGDKSNPNPHEVAPSREPEEWEIEDCLYELLSGGNRLMGRVFDDGINDFTLSETRELFAKLAVLLTCEHYDHAEVIEDIRELFSRSFREESQEMAARIIKELT